MTAEGLLGPSGGWFQGEGLVQTIRGTNGVSYGKSRTCRRHRRGPRYRGDR